MIDTEGSARVATALGKLRLASDSGPMAAYGRLAGWRRSRHRQLSTFGPSDRRSPSWLGCSVQSAQSGCKLFTNHSEFPFHERVGTITSKRRCLTATATAAAAYSNLKAPGRSSPALLANGELNEHSSLRDSAAWHFWMMPLRRQPRGRKAAL
jgi:hypothetical protein